MASLANILLVTPLTPSPAGDVLWRNADLEQISNVGVIPGKELLDELLALKSAGDAGAALGRLVPGNEHVATMCSYPAVSVRRGVVRNSQVTSTQLAVLASDVDPDVAQAAQDEITRRAALLQRATSGDLSAAVAILDATLFVVESIGALLAQSPATLTRALLGVDATMLLQRLSVLDPALREDICTAVMLDPDAQIPTAVAQWACSGTLSADAALVAVLGAKTTLRRRLTPNAQRVMIQAGHISPVNAVPAPKTYASLDDMALILDTSEIAAMYFSSQGPASDELVERILLEAPIGLVVNHILGQTMRRPLAGQVKMMLAAATSQRRLELADAMQALTEKFIASTETSPVTGLPWAGELLLGFRRARAGTLSVDAAAELFSSIDTILTGDADAWEYLLALSEEWEETIFDLIRSAAHMEGIAVDSSTDL